MLRMRPIQVIVTLCGLLFASSRAQAQSVTVTLILDTNRIPVGASTLLRAFAQIVPAQRANADRIFSWHVDLLNASNSFAAANPSQLTRTASDQDPRTSSSGIMDVGNLRAVFDTFINAPGAGRTNPVELFSVPVRGVATGRATFRLQAGTGAGLSTDFIVAPSSGGDPLLGGEYSKATAELEVIGTVLSPTLKIASSPLSAAAQRLVISFPTNPGSTYALEFRNNLEAGSDWQALPSAPHNSGTVFDTNNLPRRFYRLRVSP
jgi:hypothetical protein